MLKKTFLAEGRASLRHGIGWYCIWVVLITCSVFAAAAPGFASDVIITDTQTGNPVAGNRPADRWLAGNDNTLTIRSGGRANNSAYGGYLSYIMGSHNSTNIDSNTATVEAGGSVGNNFYGGWASVGDTAYNLTVSGNSAIVAGQVTNNVGGGGIDANNNNVNEKGEAIVDNNTVTIRKDAVIGGNVFGAMVDTYDNAGNKASTSGNKVFIEGGTISGDVYGAALNTVNANNFSANENTVTISGTPSMAGSTLYGASINGGSDHGTGNKLVLKTTGLTVTGVRDFQIIDFILPTDAVRDATVLKVTGSAALDGVEINMGMAGSSPTLKVNDTITLIDASTASDVSGADSVGPGAGLVGIDTVFGFDTEYLDGKLVAKITTINGVGGGDTDLDLKVRTQLQSVAESRMSGLGILAMGADMVEGQAIPQIRALGTQAAGLTPFAVMGASTMRYNSGSHVDVDGFTLAAGMGWNSSRGASGCGNLLLGAFFEAGWGNYDSHNSFSSAPTIRGEGDTSFYGGGILARYDTGFGLYAEGSFRVGEVQSDYSSNDFVGFQGSYVDYDATALYYGAHVGAGYTFNLSERSGLDVYAKYNWTRQGNDTARIQGSHFNFKKMDSHRVRMGARYIHTFRTSGGAQLSPYAGAAFEYEFDSKSKVAVNGVDLKSPSVKGGTGIGEVGVSYRPSAESRLSMDLGVQGYVGKREGVRGTFSVAIGF